MISLEELKFYQRNPVCFVEDFVLRQEYTHYEYQLNCIGNLISRNRYSLRSGRGPGKTLMACCAAIGNSINCKPTVILTPNLEERNIVLGEFRKISRMMSDSVLKLSVAGHFVKLEDSVPISVEVASSEHAVDKLSDLHNVIVLEAQSLDETVLKKLWNRELSSLNFIQTPSTLALYNYERLMSVTVLNCEHTPTVAKSWITGMQQKYINGPIIDNMYRIHVMGEYPVNI